MKYLREAFIEVLSSYKNNIAIIITKVRLVSCVCSTKLRRRVRKLEIVLTGPNGKVVVYKTPAKTAGSESRNLQQVYSVNTNEKYLR